MSVQGQAEKRKIYYVLYIIFSIWCPLKMTRQFLEAITVIIRFVRVIIKIAHPIYGSEPTY